jgi:hypothetical protein
MISRRITFWSMTCEGAPGGGGGVDEQQPDEPRQRHGAPGAAAEIWLAASHPETM